MFLLCAISKSVIKAMPFQNILEVNCLKHFPASLSYILVMFPFPGIYAICALVLQTMIIIMTMKLQVPIGL